MPKDNRHFGPPPIDRVWLKQQFDQLHKEHALILSKLGGGMISSALEKGILSLSTQAKKIDEKVPDKNVPPGSTTPY
jgi:hypothetical protein